MEEPIKSQWENGDPVYESMLFGEVFSHRFELTKILRQETQFMEASDMIRTCRCNDETERYFNDLSRELPSGSGSPVETPTHIYFKRLQVDVHNANILAFLPGSMLTFESKDTGQAKSLYKNVNTVLHLKPGCKVMLL